MDHSALMGPSPSPPPLAMFSSTYSTLSEASEDWQYYLAGDESAKRAETGTKQGKERHDADDADASGPGVDIAAVVTNLVANVDDDDDDDEDDYAVELPINTVFHSAKLNAEKILLSLYRK